jgi:SAM-dependent methyltransferase
MLQTHLARYRLAEPLVQGAVVLDAGCGCGYGTHYLVMNGAKRAVGIDLSLEAIDYARQHYVAPRLSYEVMDVTSLEFPDKTFDAAVCLEVFEHVPDHQEMLAEVRRVLKPDGRVVISTPNGRIFSPTGRPINPWHVREFSREEFVDALSPRFGDLELWGQTVKTSIALPTTLFHLRMQRYITDHDSRLSRFLESAYGWILKAAMAPSRWALATMKEDPTVIRRADEIPDRHTWYFIATGRKKNG